MEGTNNHAAGTSGHANGAADPEAAPPVEKKNEPQDSPFKQQKLKAWQPILTASSVLPTFFVIGIVFIPFGAWFLVSANNVYEHVIDYTDCNSSAPSANGSVQACKSLPPGGAPCQCKLPFSLADDVSDTIYVYYGLTNFYQNHRRYVKSRSDKQLLGDLSGTVNDDCKPFQKDGPGGKAYAPCGAIANSKFNDSIELYDEGATTPREWVRKGIAWSTDKSVKFKNPASAKNCGAPESDQACWKNAFNETVRPPFWQQEVWELDMKDAGNTGFENEDLIIWMRTAALPNFRKKYAYIKGGLKKGKYELRIAYSYPTELFGGRKRIILSTTSWLGGKNAFLGVAYIVVGVLCIFLGFVFLFIHLKFGKSVAELSSINAGTSFQ